MIYTNARIFTGFDWIDNASITTADGRIAEIGSGHYQPAGDSIDCLGHWLVPAFLDLQQYGLGGRLFSAYPDAVSLEVLAAENLSAGTAGCLATIATQPPEVIFKCIDAIKDYWQQGGEGILGMHLEGPFMNVAKRGAHKAEWVIPPTPDLVEKIIAEGRDVIKIITLAPECCDPAIIRMFTEAGILVSAGHSNAGYQTASGFPALGISLVTHLFNAMSPLHHRDTGLPGATFAQPDLRASIIPDGIHVSYSALSIAKHQLGSRLFFITDSVTETNIGPYQHQLNGDHYCTKDGTLSGSAITMLQGVKNAVEYAGIPLDEALRMASLYPAQVLNIEQEYGALAPGNKASMLLLNDQLELLQVINT